MKLFPNARIFATRKFWKGYKCRYSTTLIEQPQSLKRERELRPEQRLPNSPARTRFAPSPTGLLHIGSLRTALYNYLLARATKGQFILRVEDTDQKRTVPGAAERLYEDLRWAGLQWDEGPDIGGPRGPYMQSERKNLHREHAEKLLDLGHAYRCFCGPSTTQRDSPIPSCARMTRSESDSKVSDGDPYTIRLKAIRQLPMFEDLVYGTFKPSRIKFIDQDWSSCSANVVLLKTDGFSTYHLANVVDDHLMGITHVIRATEWINSTPLHAHLYNAFGWEQPTFAHVGILQNTDKLKYSKREGTGMFSIDSLRGQGFFAEALVNFLVLHGWSHDRTDDFFRLEDLVEYFDLKFTKGNTVIADKKLFHAQKMHAKYFIEEGGEKFKGIVESASAEVLRISQSRGLQLCITQSQIPDAISTLLRLDNHRYRTPTDFVEKQSYFFFREERENFRHQLFDLTTLEDFQLINERFEAVPLEVWTRPSLESVSNSIVQTFCEIKGKNLGTSRVRMADHIKSMAKEQNNFLRWAISFAHQGVGMVSTMSILGRDESLARLNDGIRWLRENQPEVVTSSQK